MQNSTELISPAKRKLIYEIMETKTKMLSKVKICDLKWLNTHYGFICVHKKKDLIRNLTPLRNKFCKLTEFSDNNYQEECPICFKNVTKTNLFITECAHIFCNNCIIRHIIICNESCPMCRKECTFEHIVRQYNDKFVQELLDRNGIMKITQSVLDTGLVHLENTRYTMANRFIWDPELIMRIIQYKGQQKTMTIVLMGVFVIPMLLLAYPLINILNYWMAICILSTNNIFLYFSV